MGPGWPGLKVFGMLARGGCWVLVVGVVLNGGNVAPIPPKEMLLFGPLDMMLLFGTFAAAAAAELILAGGNVLKMEFSAWVSPKIELSAEGLLNKLFKALSKSIWVCADPGGIDDGGGGGMEAMCPEEAAEPIDPPTTPIVPPRDCDCAKSIPGRGTCG